MTTKHLTDDDLQHYLLDDASTNNDVVGHVHTCEHCRSRLEAYRLMIIGIEQQPAPVFDFDLAELVISQLPAPAAKKMGDKLLPWIFASPAVIGGALIIYFFGSYFPRLFGDIAALTMALLALSASILATLLGIDMYRNYKKKINALDLY